MDAFLSPVSDADLGRDSVSLVFDARVGPPVFVADSAVVFASQALEIHVHSLHSLELLHTLRQLPVRCVVRLLFQYLVLNRALQASIEIVIITAAAADIIVLDGALPLEYAASADDLLRVAGLAWEVVLDGRLGARSRPLLVSVQLLVQRLYLRYVVLLYLVHVVYFQVRLWLFRLGQPTVIEWLTRLHCGWL